MNKTVIDATTISDSWFQLIRKILDVGERIPIDRGSYEGEEHRIQFDAVMINITHPYSEPYNTMLPQIPAHYGIPNPVADDYIEQYLPYILTDHIEEGETYTYGSRMYQAINYWIKELKKTKHTNQSVLEIRQPGDSYLEDPPCLSEIQMKVRDNKLHFYPVFRSWELYNGYPANLAAFAVLQKMMADEIGISIGEMCCFSSGLHIYGYAEEVAKIRTGRI